jgi:hypothetical protein
MVTFSILPVKTKGISYVKSMGEPMSHPMSSPSPSENVMGMVFCGTRSCCRHDQGSSTWRRRSDCELDGDSLASEHRRTQADCPDEDGR